MLIAIISDSHDNLTRIDQMLFLIKQNNVKTIIHCGDVTTIETLEYLSKNFNGKIYLSLGNVDDNLWNNQSFQHDLSIDLSQPYHLE